MCGFVGCNSVIFPHRNFLLHEGVIAYMLLASALPFFGKTRQDVATKILRNKYSFKSKRWKMVSAEARQFVTDLLAMDPDHRATASDALASTWLGGPLGQALSRSVLPEEETLAKWAIRKYAKYPKLKKMVSKKKEIPVRIFAFTSIEKLMTRSSFYLHHIPFLGAHGGGA